MKQGKSQHGPLAFMAGNQVVANLLMALFLVGGVILFGRLKQEVFPDFTIDVVTVTVPYPGASPDEVESGIVLAVEEAVEGIEGIDRITSMALEGVASISVEAMDGTDMARLRQEITSEVDRITTFPDESEDPQVALAAHKRGVMTLALSGAASELTLRALADQVRDELLSNESITQVDLTGVRDLEITVEMAQAALRRFGLTLEDVAGTLSRASVDMGGGRLKTPGGDILVRVKDRRDEAGQFAHIPLLTGPDGSRVLLGDVARVREGFEDSNVWASFNGSPAVMIDIHRVGDQTPTDVADAAKKTVERLNRSLPRGVSLTILQDYSDVYIQRAELLVKNAWLGLILVFVCLALFLEIRLAFWVSLGIPISFLGSFLVLSAADFSINMISMFAFIVTLGIVVDDAVVVGENIYHYRQKGLTLFDAAVAGVREVAMPVVFSVLTNMVAFLPMMFIPGVMGKIFKVIPVVVTAVFAISLIESLFILPAHLAHGRRTLSVFPFPLIERFQKRFSLAFEDFVRNAYGKTLERMLARRYSVTAFGIALMLATAGYVSSGRMGMVMFPVVESDFAYCAATLPYGSSKERLADVERRLVDAAARVVDEHGGPTLSRGILSNVSDNTVTVRLFLTDAETRPLPTAAVTRLWRSAAGRLTGLETIRFESNMGGPGSGKNLTVMLSHRDKDILEAAGEDLSEQLGSFAGVQDIDDGSARGKRQYDIRLKPLGERMGLTSRSVALQIRHAFQGAEALRQQRGRNEITVRVSLPEEERATEATLETLILRTPTGEVALSDAVSLTQGRAYTAITRTDGRRVISVTANVSPASRTEAMLVELKKNLLPELIRRHPGLSFSFEGHQAEIRKSIGSLITGLSLALFGIFALLAIPFKSYAQPLIIMASIPFGMIGAVLGHVLMGYSLSVISLFGVVALAGVVVNGALVLIDFTNRLVARGASPAAAVRDAGIQRFRPILLTTLTTFGGLTPMIFETSRQARMMIPMAISLGFGVLFSTLITLVLVPSLYLILEDVRQWRQKNQLDSSLSDG
ncbi:efflux RND transporter permease subunit [Desulfatiferula olefinivorans]